MAALIGLVLVNACLAKQSFPLVVPGSGRSIGGFSIDAEVRLTLVERVSPLVIGHRDPILPLQTVQQFHYTNGKSIRYQRKIDPMPSDVCRAAGPGRAFDPKPSAEVRSAKDLAHDLVSVEVRNSDDGFAPELPKPIAPSAHTRPDLPAGSRRLCHLEMGPARINRSPQSTRRLHIRARYY